ncbi:MAG: bile acid:sodium symporter family protein [Kangiellaceae bacterium]|jgi:BASS family bile acid:Na+ symporter|nr:bile acid:sodium symporter family protein [Kangiellaceae bacterium]
MEASVLSTVVLPLALFIIMLGMGMSLTPKDFNEVLLHPKAVSLGIITQMIMLPLFAYAIALMFGMTGALAVGLMILALCPGGTTSNLYTYLAKGDIALSITLTSIVSLIAPFTVPLLIVLSMDIFIGESTEVTLPVIDTIVQLIAITIVPISIGMVIRKFKPVIADKSDKPVKIFSVVFLALVVTGLVLQNIKQMAGYFLQAGLAALVLNVVCMAAGFWIARFLRLNRGQSIAIGIEVGFQNGTLAIVIALSLIKNTEMAIAATVYSLIMFATGAIFAWLLNYKSPVSIVDK